ncbi:MAG: endonuclease/exonuclease/phosphatase family protein [Octadecabacter sp.]
MTSTPLPFSCITWNVHRCRGNDGVVDPDRTFATLRDDVWQAGFHALVLTEADGDGPPYSGLMDTAKIETMTGLRCVHTTDDHKWGPASGGFLGVIMFLHPSFKIQTVTALDLPGRVHRGAVVVEAAHEGVSLRIIGTHLSLIQPLRWAQMRVIAQHIQRQPNMPTVLVGDLNEWRPWGGGAFLHHRFGVAFAGPAKATFPARWPVFPLDRVLTAGPAVVRSIDVATSAGIRLASDHRPLIARVEVGS